MDIPNTCSPDDEVFDIEILRPDGTLLNTVRMTECDAAWTCAIHANAGWNWRRRPDPAPEVEAPSQPQVPASVTRRQARQALLLAGLLDQVQVAIDAIPDPVQRGMLQIEWDDGQTFDRDRPTVLTIGAALGLDDAGLDQLFIAAAAL